jgi:MFS family permease
VLSPYQRILTLPGTLAFSSAGFVARMPLSMVSLGIVVLVSARSGSYGLAGGVAAAYIVANAGFAIVQGRLTDRLGQRVVLLGSITVFAGALVGLMVVVELGWSAPWPHLLAALCGAGLPQVGSSVRARWTHVLSGRDDGAAQLHTAFSLEAVVDEAVFMFGPVVVTVLATTVSPLAGLGSALAFGVVGTCLLAAQRATAPPVHAQPQGTGARPALGWRLLLPVSMAGAALGAVFGAVELVTVAFARNEGHAAAAGWLLAVWSASSMASGLLYGVVAWRASHRTRLRLGMAVLGLSLLPLPFVSGLLLLGVVLFISGFAISPTLVSMMSLVEASVPASRLTEGIAWVSTGLSAGIAPGAAVAGWVVDGWGTASGYVVSLVAGLVGIAVTLATPAQARRGAVTQLSAD